MAYIDQFDDVVRAQDRGHATRNMRTIAVFTDGLVVCAAGIEGGPAIPVGGLLGGLLRAGRPQGQQKMRSHRDQRIRDSAEAMGADGTAEAFAQTRPKARAIPFAVVRRIVLAQDGQDRKLVIYADTANPDRAIRSAYFCNLSAQRVREVLGPLLGNRLKIEVRD
jgi:hypothetical protein